MKRLYTDQNSLMIGNIKNILENHDIECIIKNFMLVGSVGELPPTVCSTELWVVNDEKYAQAKEIVKDIFSEDKKNNSTWKCRNCGESVEEQFTDCWNCGESK
jgi:hypothetical protein